MRNEAGRYIRLSRAAVALLKGIENKSVFPEIQPGNVAEVVVPGFGFDKGWLLKAKIFSPGMLPLFYQHIRYVKELVSRIIHAIAVESFFGKFFKLSCGDFLLCRTFMTVEDKRLDHSMHLPNGLLFNFRNMVSAGHGRVKGVLQLFSDNKHLKTLSDLTVKN